MNSEDNLQHFRNNSTQTSSKTMNRRLFSLTSTICTVLLSVAAQLNAQTWVTHSTFAGASRTVLIDPSATVTPPAALVGGGAMGGIVAVASDGSYTLTTGSGPDSCFRLGLDTSLGGHLFAAGSSGTPGTWVVHESNNGGANWSLANSFSLAAKYSCARGFASDGKGNVFVCGGATDSSGYSHWIVRRRDASGTWKTVQDISIRRSDCYASAMYIVNGTLFIVGQSGNKWMVQRGSNLGASSLTWGTPYTWVPSKTGSAQANAVTADGAGNIYVFGVNGSAAFGFEAVATSAVLQKSSDLGNTWVIAATFKPTGSGANRAHDMAFDASGNLFLASAANFSYSPNPTTVVSAWKWVVYRRDATTGIWEGAFPSGVDPADGKNSLAKGISTDAKGNVFVTGPVQDSSGNYVTEVQRLVP